MLWFKSEASQLVRPCVTVSVNLRNYAKALQKLRCQATYFLFYAHMHAATLGCAGAQWNDLAPGEGEAGNNAIAGELPFFQAAGIRDFLLAQGCHIRYRLPEQPAC